MIRSPLRKFARTLAPLGAGFVLLLSSRAALAKTEFFITMTQPPYEWKGDCRLCHQDPVGIGGSATKPFAQALKARGLGATSPSSQLTQILNEWDGTDSDGDGKSDVEELLTQGDPNAGTGVEPVRAVEYGYGCLSVASGPATGGGWTWALIVAACWWRRRARGVDQGSAQV